MFRGLQSRRYDIPTRLVFVLGGIVGILVSYIFSVKGFGTQVPDMLWAARGIVVFFIALQIYVNRNKSEEQKNWALIVGGLASYVYGIYTNIVGILAFGGMSIDQISIHNWYYMIIPVMVGFPLEIAPEALLMMGFFPDNDTVMSDALSGFAGIWRAITDQGNPRPSVSSMTSRGGGEARRAALERQYRPAPEVRAAPAVRDLSSPQPPANRTASPLNRPVPGSRPAPNYHMIGEAPPEEE